MRLYSYLSLRENATLSKVGRTGRTAKRVEVGRAVSPKPPNDGAHGVHALPKAEGWSLQNGFLTPPGRGIWPTTVGAGQLPSWPILDGKNFLSVHKHIGYPRPRRLIILFLNCVPSMK